MDQVLRILNINPNISNSNYIPTINEWMTGIEPLYKICIGIGILCTIISMILSAVHLYYVFFYISSEEIQTDLYWLVFMSPIVSLCGTVGMLIPRSAIFLYDFVLLYLMLCIFITVTIMTTLHGSRKEMCAKFLSGDRKINPRILPLGHCLVCLPDIEPNEMNVRRIEWLVFQSLLLRIFLEIMNIVVFMEINTRKHKWFQVTNVLGIISWLIGSYGSYMMVSLGSEFLKAYRFSLMFYMVDTTQLIYYLNKLVLDYFNRVKFFGYDSVLSSSAKSQFWMSFLLTIEMLVISFMTSYFFRPSKTAFFDKYDASPVGHVAPKKFSPMPPTATCSINLDDVETSTEQTDVESFKSYSSYDQTTNVPGLCIEAKSRYISSKKIQTHLYWLVFMSPMISLCGTVGMLLPRSATYLYGFAILYSMLCIFITVTTMTTLHGSRKAMCAKFLSQDRKISPRIFPCCCCLVCLPDIEPNEMNVRRIEWLVFQSPLLRMFLGIMDEFVFMEIDTRKHIWFYVTGVLWIISLFIGLYGSNMMASLGSQFLKAYRFSLMFYMVDTTQLICYLNILVLHFFDEGQFLGHDSVLSSSTKSQFWSSFLLTIEMLVISFMTSFFFRPSKTAFFDKYDASPVEHVAPKKFSPMPPTPTRSIKLDDVETSTEQTDVESFKSYSSYDQTTNV